MSGGGEVTGGPSSKRARAESPPPVISNEVATCSLPVVLISCNICRELLRGRVYQCGACTHPICGNCLNTILEGANPRCPHCKEPATIKTFARAAFVEGLIGEFQACCTNEGCGEWALMKNMEAHMERCPYRPFQCCGKCFTRDEMADHIVNEHRAGKVTLEPPRNNFSGRFQVPPGAFNNIGFSWGNILEVLGHKLFLQTRLDVSTVAGNTQTEFCTSVRWIGAVGAELAPPSNLFLLFTFVVTVTEGGKPSQSLAYSSRLLRVVDFRDGIKWHEEARNPVDLASHRSQVESGIVRAFYKLAPCDGDQALSIGPPTVPARKAS